MTLDDGQIAKINDIKITANTLYWAKANLSHFFVQKQSVYFILDAQFEHFWQYDKCINFICQTFASLNDEDCFGLHNLGDQQYNVLLEEKQYNRCTKMQLLRTLRRSLEDCILQRREVDVRRALDDAV